ncbi:hypothetical protein GCM10010441_06070 [Kitasatospora paracochleata]|uniref:LPXTG-motif cell wall-anchored protein n=1 Tax=Kitasatospora paracochleata TaxID=58354 RepID=A0ABT1IYD5_9ACTN|nr:hypothetical protein [Kitasatospora paracochleata]MCP2309536.1 hypothetical protein [Kitasatospora paracochleata]
MTARISRAACAAAAIATGTIVVTVTFAGAAYADGSSSPFSGRTEGGSLVVKSGDIVACEGAGQVVVATTEGGKILSADGPGTKITTPAGAVFETLADKSVKVSFQGADAVVTCPADQVPTTPAFVPKSSLAGTGGSVHGMNTTATVAGGALVAAGLAGGAVVLRRRSGGGRA